MTVLTIAPAPFHNVSAIAGDRAARCPMSCDTGMLKPARFYRLRAMNHTTVDRGRLRALDQFRGYTVVGMILVNFLGHFAATPAILKHHNTYCSLADTIMPQFLFAVGFAYRMTLLRRLAPGSVWSPYARALRRNVGLIVLGVVIYHLDGRANSWNELTQLGFAGFFRTAFQRNLFQTLVHIAVTSIWVMPVIAAGQRTRMVFMTASGVLHVFLSYRFYYDWVMTRPGIDGGPLGFLTWTIPLLVGSLAYDAIAATSGRSRVLPRLVLVAGILMATGYGLSCLTRVVPAVTAFEKSKAREFKARRTAEAGLAPAGVLVEPPFVPPSRAVGVWTMSQRAGSVSYLVFGSGLSLLVLALFVGLSDFERAELGVFRTFGTNALAAYVIHDLVAEAVKPYAPKDSPLWYAVLAFAVYFGVNWLFVRHLERQGLYVRM